MIFHPMTHGLRLGLGCAPLGNLFAAIDDDAALALIRRAWDSGCRSFDTAPHYGNGLSEHRLGQGLRGRDRDDFTLSSKVGRLLRPDASAPRAQNGYVDVLPFVQAWDYSARGVRRSVEDSLQRLGLARLDVAYVHDCDAGVHGPDYPRVLRQVVEEALPELHRMRDEGLLRHVGLGVNDVQVCLDVLARAELDCLLLAGRYSLVDHTALAELLPVCEQRGVRIALGGVFNSGILATGVRGSAGAPLRFNYGRAPQHWIDRVAAVEDACARHAVPLRAAALQFPLAHPAVDIVLLGPQDPSQWDDGVAMLGHAVPQAFWQALHAAGLVPPAAPLPAPAGR
ncbi:MAG: aldo/keto reductase [Rhodoferax sp.]|nr:aldo/keto reductase [Rhodoferax sp.]MCW5628500.1 aldo/keto reductase [Rhodoferax sp.]